MKQRNDKRRAELYARNYGPEADVVRAQPCLVRGCRGFVVAAHVVPRGMGGCNGCRFDLAPLCEKHHLEAGEWRTSARSDFEKRYGLDLRLIADRIAVEHVEPLGLRGVATRWVFELPGDPAPYEREALFAWVRRSADRTVSGAPGPDAGGFAVADVARALGVEMLVASLLLATSGWGRDGMARASS